MNRDDVTDVTDDSAVFSIFLKLMEFFYSQLENNQSAHLHSQTK